jgi:hypothetical protein
VLSSADLARPLEAFLFLVTLFFLVPRVEGEEVCVSAFMSVEASSVV